MTRTRVLLFVKGAVALALIGWLASTVDRAALAGVLRQVQPVPLMALVAVALLMVGVSCWKWSLLLRAQGIRLPARYLLKTYFVGYFFTNFLPTGIGGDAVRAMRVGQATGRRGASLLAVFFDRVDQDAHTRALKQDFGCNDGHFSHQSASILLFAK